LGHLRGDSLWRTVPVVVVSTSWQPKDVSDTYRLGAAGYLLKPLDLDAFAAAIARVVAYWFDTVVLPLPAGA
jgi:DNA-binding NarL/FixJ family response regulator